MRHLTIGLVVVLGAIAIAASAVYQLPSLRQHVKALIRPEPPPPITPLALGATAPGLPASPVATPAAPRPSTNAESTLATDSGQSSPSLSTSIAAIPASTVTIAPNSSPELTAGSAAASAAASTPTAMPATADQATPMAALVASATVSPVSATAAPSPTAGLVEINGRFYDAYIPAALKEQQAYQYSCEFDAAWVIFETFGRQVSVDEMIAVIGVDLRVEPYIEETAEGIVIHGGDIASTYSGDYTSNFLARSTGQAMRGVFEHFGLSATPVHDRAGVEAALRAGQLVWMKTTVDFKPWRPAIWRTPEGQTFRTVLGNDHAVVVIGFNAEAVVIRDVLGPTSSNWQRPYEYEVDWATFLQTWEAQAFDGLAVAGSQ